jgi:hypothetical protein
VKLALNIFVARLILEAAHRAILWVATEVLNFRAGRASGSLGSRR